MSEIKLFIKENNDSIEIELGILPASIWKMIFVFLLAFCIGIMALIILNIAIQDLPEIEYSLYIGVFLLLVTAFYFLKLFLWYKGGKEIYIIESNRLIYQSDFSIRLNRTRIYPFETISIIYWEPKRRVNENVLDDLSEQGGKAALGFELNGKKYIDTTVHLPKYQLRRLADVVSKRHG